MAQSGGPIEAGRLSVFSTNIKLHAHITMILSILVGYLGFDRFYRGQVGWGIFKLLTGGGLLIWWLVDAIYYTYKANETLR